MRSVSAVLTATFVVLALASVANAQTLPASTAGEPQLPQLPSVPQFSDPIVQADFNLFQKLDIGQRFGITFKQHVAVCAAASAGNANCDARVITNKQGRPAAQTAPAGYSPAQLLKAYDLAGVSSASKPPVIAIVDAYDDPNIVSDLSAYDTQFGIPQLPACSGAIGSASSACFQKVNENGSTTSHPSGNSGWDLEISLDVEIAHATCQNCSILLVEANSNAYSDLMTAEGEAVALGANVVSNSWGGSEFSGETSYDSYFNHRGIAFVASAGDSGYGVEYPAASPYVTAVGGTSLYLNSDGSYNSEVAWTGTGSGCSAYEAKPTWQTDTGCMKRTVNDVSADADPNTGAAIYDSVRYDGESGWFQVGGTSLASPLIAATFAQTGNIPSGTQENSLPYADTAALHDVMSGSNGSCGGSYLCTAMVGYDAPTGLGSPNGIAAFTTSSSSQPPPLPPPPPVQSFSLSANTSLSVSPSGKATDAITVTPAGGFTGSVTLSASGLPSNVTASFSKNPTKNSSTLTLSATKKALAGTYAVTIKGTSASLTSSVAITLTVL